MRATRNDNCVGARPAAPMSALARSLAARGGAGFRKRSKGQRLESRRHSAKKHMEWIGVAGIVVGLVFFVIAAMKDGTCSSRPSSRPSSSRSPTAWISHAPWWAESSYVTGLAGLRTAEPAHLRGRRHHGRVHGQVRRCQGHRPRRHGKVGNKSPYLVLLGIAAVGAVLTYAGISMFVAMFAPIPLARPLFKELQTSVALFCAAGRSRLLVHHVRLR